MRKLFSRSIVKIATIFSLTSLVQSAQFHLPAGTPGRQEIRKPTGNIAFQVAFKKIKNTIAFCERVVVPNTTCDLYFQINGQQPTTSEAGQYSGARYVGQPNNDLVTDWWVRVFGGNRAVAFSKGKGQAIQPKEPKMGISKNNKCVHIIHVNTTGANKGFKQQFWQAFRTIAANPVGRVLLYRLLIEIRRLDGPGGNGCWGDGIATTDPTLKNRNKTRSIEVYYSNKSSFNFSKQRINIFLQNKTLQTFKIENGYLTTAGENRTGDIALFHEMLHWFHHLRHHQRCLDNKQINGFKYNTRCYYGSGYELCVWGAEIKEEEIATILGSPNYRQETHINLMPKKCFFHNDPGDSFYVENLGYVQQPDKFLNGDDLSENVYRVSKGCRMRFGHSSQPIKPVTMYPIPNRFKLAQKVAIDCYKQITGNIHWIWNLVREDKLFNLDKF